MKYLFTFLVSFVFLIGHAQKNCALVYGDFSALVNQASIYVKIEFDSLNFAGYGNESEFVAKMKKNFEEKKTGEGVRWEQDWNEKRISVFDTRFKVLFYKHSELDDQLASYCLVVRPTKLYTGFKTDDETPKAFLSGEAWLIKISEPNKKLAKLFFTNIAGDGVINDPTGFLRIGDSYALAGKTIGGFVKKSIRQSKKGN